MFVLITILVLCAASFLVSFAGDRLTDSDKLSAATVFLLLLAAVTALTTVTTGLMLLSGDDSGHGTPTCGEVTVRSWDGLPSSEREVCTYSRP